MKSYFDENMKLLKDENLDSLFSGNPIYTKVRDDNPTRYINGSKAKNVMVADGCVIKRNRKQHFVPWCQGSQGSKSKELHSDAGYCD